MDTGYLNSTAAITPSYGVASPGFLYPNVVGGSVTFGSASIGQSGPVKIEDAGVSRVVRLALSNSPFEEVTAETDADTGVINLTIGCQTHPIERWKRIGARLIRRHYGHDEKRLSAALPEVIKRIEAELKKKAA